MTWDAYNRRKDVLREVLALADTAPGETSATTLLDTVPGARDAFPADVDLLFEVQLAWTQRLTGQMDRLLTEGSDDLETLTITAWIEAARQMPGARALLDAATDEPALQKAFAKERALLAASAGVPTHHPDLEGHGRRIATSARANVTYRPIVVPAPENRFIARLKQLVA